MIKLELPFWLGGAELTKLQVSAQAWWETVEHWVGWPLRQLDAETCHLAVLDLLAWQRDISRFRGESESLYRLRVKYAFVNAVDAGSVSGFVRIFQRLGIGAVRISERQPDRDWDIVQLHLSDEQLSENPTLLDMIVHQYGRTCRRYELVVTTNVALSIGTGEFSNDQTTVVAKFSNTDSVSLFLGALEFNNDQMTLVTR